jgi:hypothetical protein
MSPKKNFFQNVMDAMIEARSIQAERELAMFRGKPHQNKDVL